MLEGVGVEFRDTDRCEQRVVDPLDKPDQTAHEQSRTGVYQE